MEPPHRKMEVNLELDRIINDDNTQIMSNPVQVITRADLWVQQAEILRIAHVAYLPHLNMLKAQLQFQVAIDVENVTK